MDMTIVRLGYAAMGVHLHHCIPSQTMTFALFFGNRMDRRHQFYNPLIYQPFALIDKKMGLMVSG
jgi:UV DNA damage repair endonuclease